MTCDPEPPALADHVQELDGFGPDDPDDDLAAWSARLDGVRVVGLGLTTPGSRELTALAHRLLAHVVRRHGSRVVALVAGESATVRVDEHVREGRGSAADALHGLRSWTWSTLEMTSVVRWLAEVSREELPEHRVAVLGLDPRRPVAAVVVIGRFLRAAAPDLLAEVSPTLAELVAGREGSVAAQAHAAATRIAAVLDADEAALVAATSPARYEEARRHVGFLLRSAELGRAAPREAAGVRSRLLAEGVTAALAGAGDGPVVVWGHADDLLVRGGDAAPLSAGAHLRAQLGEAYHPVGLTVGSGNVRAVRRGFFGPARSPSRCRLGDPAAGTLEAALGAAGPELHLLDVDAAAADPVIGAWTRAAHPRRAVDEEVPTGPSATTPCVPADEAATLAYSADCTPVRDR